MYCAKSFDVLIFHKSYSVISVLIFEQIVHLASGHAYTYFKITCTIASGALIIIIQNMNSCGTMNRKQIDKNIFHRNTEPLKAIIFLW